MTTFNIIASCIGIVAALAQVVSLVLQIRSTQAIANSGTGPIVVSASSVVAMRPPPRSGESTTRVIHEYKGSRDDQPGSDPWYVLLGAVAATVFVVSLYLRYRVDVLLAVSGVLVMCFGVNLYFLVSMRKHGVFVRSFRAGAVFALVNFGSAFALLLHFYLRSTPGGSYSDVSQRVRVDGAASLISQPELLFFLALEIVALGYVLVAIILLTLRQLGTLAMISAVVNGSRPTWFTRFGPTKARGLWLFPLMMLLLQAFITFFSSAWFAHYMATRPLPLPG